MRSILFIIISLLTLSSIRAQELVRSYYDVAETQIKEEFYVVSKTDPALQGAYTSFDETGGIKSEGFFENNVSTGLWTFYYPNGKPRMAGEIRDGKNFGAWTYYFDSGKKKMAGLIIEGKREGPWVIYYKNEAKQSEGKFISNIFRGYLSGLIIRFMSKPIYFYSFKRYPILFKLFGCIYK